MTAAASGNAARPVAGWDTPADEWIAWGCAFPELSLQDCPAFLLVAPHPDDEPLGSARQRPRCSLAASTCTWHRMARVAPDRAAVASKRAAAKEFRSQLTGYYPDTDPVLPPFAPQRLLAVGEVAFID